MRYVNKLLDRIEYTRNIDNNDLKNWTLKVTKSKKTLTVISK